jgi:hypothetical protein
MLAPPPSKKKKASSSVSRPSATITNPGTPILDVDTLFNHGYFLPL